MRLTAERTWTFFKAVLLRVSLLLALLIYATSAIGQIPSTASEFKSAGNLANARLAHTATLLADGRVLVAGGGQGPDLIDGFWVVPQVELFDPVSATFTSAGSSARDGHTATLLKSGEVLLVGGETGWCDCSPFLTPAPILTPGAEVYDSVTGQFRPAGNMSVKRESHTATLLLDGRVLIAGGTNLRGLEWQSLSSAEIYEPTTGAFSETGSMSDARFSHSATLLVDGRVLITGGWNTRGRLASAEIYDPATGAFTTTGSMSFQRSFHAAALLANGQVLVTGGQPDGATTAEVYDPTTGSFTPTGTMMTPRMWHTTTLLQDGTVLVVGGWVQIGDISSVELYYPATGSFTRTGNLITGRLSHTATLLSDGSVLVIGGGSSDDGIHLNVLSSAEIYKYVSLLAPALLVTDLRFDRTSVAAGAAFSFNISGPNLTPQTFFDVRFSAPGSNTYDVVLNWQRGLSAKHGVPAGTAAGSWTINGVRAHQDEADHTGGFVSVSAAVTVSP